MYRIDFNILNIFNKVITFMGYFIYLLQSSFYLTNELQQQKIQIIYKHVTHVLMKWRLMSLEVSHLRENASNCLPY